MQVIDRIPPDTLFSDYFYFSSAIGGLKSHFQNHARQMLDRFLPDRNGTVVEFGCNDGVLLNPIAQEGVCKVIGVDPASNVISQISDERIIKINDYFSQDVAKAMVSEHGRADLIFANNVFAHIDDIQDATKAVREALDENGVFVFEVHYLGKIIEETQFDMIYHEHIYYYSLISAIAHLERQGLSVFDVEEISNHGGSLRIYACHQRAAHATQTSRRLEELIQKEKSLGLDKAVTYLSFGAHVESVKHNLLRLVTELKNNGKKIAGYGASGRANTILQFCGLNDEILDCIIDDAPAKQGFFTPGSHLQIVDRRKLCGRERPDYVIVFAWSFLNEILAKNQQFKDEGGKFIVPLPEVRII